MNRTDVLLATLAAAEGRPFTPVQLQKAMFLLSRNAPHLVDEGANFQFVAYDYGPFDSAVYSEAQNLEQHGLASIQQSSSRFRTYAATAHGQELGQQILAAMPEDARRYVTEVANWVRSMSFAALVKSIYEAYPEMRENSIFRG